MIFYVIAEGLLLVQNALFRERFREKFNLQYLTDENQDALKNITNINNPLYQLIQLDQRENSRSLLVRDLIELICDQIEMTRDELMQDTFYQPSKSTLTYLILFDQLFITLPIHMKMIQDLISIWKKWQSDGFQVTQINSWNRLDTEQRRIAGQIWNGIGTNLGQNIPFEELIEEAKRRIEDIIKTKENVTSCINIYCQDARDTEDYRKHLQDLQNQLDQATVYSAKISEQILALKPFADRLQPVISSRLWQKYLKDDLKGNCKLMFFSSDTDHFLSDSLDSFDEDGIQMTCLEALKRATEILDQFQDRLTLLCTDKTQLLFPQLRQFFPETHFIDHELRVLKPLLDDNTARRLDILLEYWKNQAYINQICEGYQYMLAHYQISPSIKLSVSENILAMHDEISSETCLTVYQDYCNHYSNRYSKVALDLIAYWSSSNELLKFLHSLETTGIDDLLEVVNDWDETLINTQTVLDLVSLKRFFDKVEIKVQSIRLKKSVELDDILCCSEETLNEIEFKNILTNVESCSKNLSALQRISLDLTNKEQSKRRRILDIVKSSNFCFFVSQLEEGLRSGEYGFDVHVTNDNREPIAFDDLSDLRDRARLIQYAGNKSQNSTDEQNEQLKSFVSLVDTVEVILRSFTSLSEAGYPVVKEYHTSPKKFTCDGNKYQELEKFRSSLERQLTDWEKQLCTIYKECINLTYFSHQQIWMLVDALHRQTITIPDDSSYHLLKFIGIDPQSIQTRLLPEKTEQPLDLLQIVASAVRTKHDLDSFSRQEDNPKNKKVFLIEITNKGILRAIYSLFHLNNTPAVANSLFYCTKKTNWAEIRAFIYRCFYSQTLHQLIRPELLSIVVQDQLAHLLRQFIEQCPDHLFRLGVITTISTAHLHLVTNLNKHHIIRTIHDHEMLSETDLEDRIRKLIGNNCILVTSRIAGLGKSTYIRNEATRLGKRAVKFPINGDVNIDILTDRLRDSQIQSIPSTILIHIDIGPVENVQQLNEFLYCLILFRCFRVGHMPACVPANIPIYIELDSSSYLAKLTDDIVVFKYLTTKPIDAMDWNELEMNQSSRIQLVSNYLQAIDDETINTTDINEETMSILDKPTCIRLLQKHFLQKKNIHFISWTQLTIFISVFYKLFSGFSKCGYFLVDPQTQSSLRLDILKSLLNSSDQFTSLSVEKVRQNQRSIYTSETLTPFSEAIIRWDQSQPFTIIFTSTDEPLFIYKVLKDIPDSLNEAFLYYYKLMNKNSARRNKFRLPLLPFFIKRRSTSNAASAESSIRDPKEQLQEFLADPNQMTHEQFFLRLTSLSTKYFTDKPICETCFTQYQYDAQQCTACQANNSFIRPISTNSQNIEEFQKIIAQKLRSTYVLTADNYVKMLLIYLRVQGNLPVLIMGETGQTATEFCPYLVYVFVGCGKTALIQCLCQKILDDEMEVFHIHAGVTNNIIIETMHDLISKAHKCAEKDAKKRLWVFFDEFNTTPNIGLLKEIICERTLLGESLPNNMVFLGACNPQRRKNNKQPNGSIDVQRLAHDVDSSLLYSVVAIPESMLEHVWDYGYLDEATEKSYIRTILNACEQLSTNQTWFRCVVNLISKSQKLIREREDVSSVSLRDVARFCRFYNWFYSKFPLPSQKSSVPINQIERASLLTLFLCYYFRLDSSTSREDYMKTIADTIAKSTLNVVSLESLTEFLQNEKMALVEQMELPPGTAKNRALTDNIFVLFTCIFNRLPVILCGKPGCSKTSAVQIIISNMKGKHSQNSFFQSLQGLIAISYQGSHNCTSESIIKVFGQADKFTQANNRCQFIASDCI